jgi:hypothetical protein
VALKLFICTRRESIELPWQQIAGQLGMKCHGERRARMRRLILVLLRPWRL